MISFYRWFFFFFEKRTQKQQQHVYCWLFLKKQMRFAWLAEYFFLRSYFLKKNKSQALCTACLFVAKHTSQHVLKPLKKWFIILINWVFLVLVISFLLLFWSYLIQLRITNMFSLVLEPCNLRTRVFLPILAEFLRNVSYFTWKWEPRTVRFGQFGTEKYNKFTTSFCTVCAYILWIYLGIMCGSLCSLWDMCLEDLYGPKKNRLPNVEREVICLR